MRLLFIAPYTPLLTKPRPYNFLLHLAKKYEIYLLCFGDYSPDQLANHPDYITLKANCQHIEHIPIAKSRIAWNLLSGTLFTDKPLRVSYYGPSFARERIRQIVRENKIDVIHVDRSRLAGLTQGIDIPKILDLTDSITWYIKQCLHRSSLHMKPVYLVEHMRMQHYEKTVGSDYNQCLITNQHDRQWFKDTPFFDRINVVPNAIDKAFFEHQSSGTQSNHTLLFYGNLSYYPNVDGIKYFCRHIFPEIQHQVRDVKLQIVGNKPARVIERLAKKSGIEVTGWVPSLIQYIASVSVVISPLRIGVGFPNKIAESLAVGKAVVSSDIGCRGLENSDQAILTAHNDLEFITATTQLLNDTHLRTQLEHKAWTYARNYLRPEYALAALDKVYAKI
ncbi:MAG: glycosyltransferase [Anaerolineae bacterium]|nr:glycosyltransferase [Anaerolineae bacterium]